MVSGDLQSFGSPRVPGGPDPSLTAGNEGLVDVFFPLPPGEVHGIDFSTLKLRLVLEGSNGKIHETITFHGRIRRDHYHTYGYEHYPPYGYGYGGYGYAFRYGCY